jgi:hypothetical protein
MISIEGEMSKAKIQLNLSYVKWLMSNISFGSSEKYGHLERDEKEIYN